MQVVEERMHGRSRGVHRLAHRRADPHHRGGHVAAREYLLRLHAHSLTGTGARAANGRARTVGFRLRERGRIRSAGRAEPTSSSTLRRRRPPSARSRGRWARGGGRDADRHRAGAQARQGARQGRAGGEARRRPARDRAGARLPSWPALVHALEPPTAERVSPTRTAAGRALDLLEAAPELRADPWVALSLGDASRIGDAAAPGRAAARRAAVLRGAQPDRRATPLRRRARSCWAAAPTRTAPERRGLDDPLGGLLARRRGARPDAAGRGRRARRQRLALPLGRAATGLHRALAARARRRGERDERARHALDYEPLEPVRLLLDARRRPERGARHSNLHHAVARAPLARVHAAAGRARRRSRPARRARPHRLPAGRAPRPDELAMTLAELGSPTDVETRTRRWRRRLRRRRPGRARARRRRRAAS